MRISSHSELPGRGKNGEGRLVVNRLLDFSQISALGFDLDHTLAVYRDQVVNEAAFRETAGLLVSELGYPHELTRIPYRDSMIIRGLCIDSATGFLLKLDRDSRVVRAAGLEGVLGPDAIRSVYGDGPVSPLPPRFDTLNSPFDKPVGVLYTAAMALVARHGPPRDPDVVHGDVRRLLDRAHTTGTLKKTILDHPDRFLRSLTQTIPALWRLKSEGLKTFVLTNSGYDYAVCVLDHLIGGGADRMWRSLFDAVIVDAAKPAFFNSPPDTADPTSAPGERVFRGATVDWLERYLGVSRRSVLYAGDNPADDCEPASRRGWKTALVVPEIDGERDPRADGAPESDRSICPWGSLFQEDGIPTRFGRFLADIPDLYAADIDLIVDLCGPLG